MFPRREDGDAQGSRGAVEAAEGRMDRTVPRTGSEEIELYIRTYYSLLRSTTDVQIRTLEEAHANMGSSLHPDARQPFPDMSAFIYSTLRLPPCIVDVERLVLGQSQEIFRARGFGDIESWERVSARARRRRSFYDGEHTLACYFGSRSDIDDVIPILTAFQIEWNKLHHLMKGELARAYLENPVDDEEGLAVFGRGIGVQLEDLHRLRTVWGEDFWSVLRTIASRKKRMKVRLLSGSLNDYRRATQMWWEPVERMVPDVRERPVYLVSSNTHSLVNLLTGFALRHEDEIVRFLDDLGDTQLQDEWHVIKSRQSPSSQENFLYYIFKKYEATRQGQALKAERLQAEREHGIQRIASEHSFDLPVQVIDLAALNLSWVDSRLARDDIGTLQDSDALIVNTDYPLGMAAYEILSYVASRVGELLGIYCMGKAATLNGVVGDIMIPSVLHDEQSQNTYLFDNCFSAADVADQLVYGTAMDNQKAISVRGTFLQTPRYMDVFYREGYTDIEMETGPYLSAIYELYRPKRHPNDEVVDLHGLPFDVGVIHYASDTPLSKGRNLGAGSLSYYGMDPTYAASLAILRRIFDLELGRVRSTQVSVAG